MITRDTLLSGYEMYLAETTASIRKPARCGAMIFTVCRRCISLPRSTILYAMRAKRCISI
jgi:hypothetical protein